MNAFRDFKFGIHLRLMMVGVLLIGATTFALGQIGGRITYQFVQSRFDERMNFLARYLALNAELGILIGDRNMLARLAENLLSEKDVVRVLIYDQTELLTDVSGERSGKTADAEMAVTSKRAGGFPWNMSRKSDSDVIGRVRIVYTTDGIDRLLSLMQERFLWLSLGLSAVSVVIFYFISRSLVSPVTRLAMAARAVARGNMDLRVRPGRLPETRELAIAFNAMLDSLARNREALEAAHQKMVQQEMLAQKGKFSLLIAHEFKNPLSIIKSSMDILKKQIENPRENLMVSYIEDEIRRLNLLIEDFLMFARPAAPNLRATDLFAMLLEHLTRLDLQMNGAPLTIETDVPEEAACEARVDPDLLMRAFANILKNAGEANEGKGILKVKAWCEEGDWIATFDDDGPGIDEEHLPKIFEPFYTTRSKGTGLGLAYVQQVLEAHGGSVSAENRDEGGARFTVRIPVSACEEELHERPNSDR